MYNNLGYENKETGMTIIKDSVWKYSLSDDHEVNKKLLYTILKVTEILLQGEEMLIAYSNKDPEALREASDKKWVI